MYYAELGIIHACLHDKGGKLHEVPARHALEGLGQSRRRLRPHRQAKADSNTSTCSKLIKRWGEERGYKATIEKQTLSGDGSVDVALEKDGQAIACEITVTTTVEHEVANITKCLSAGFGHVIVVASDKKALNKIQTAAKVEIGESDLNKVFFFLPENLYVYLDQLAAEGKGKEEVVKGYKVKVQYKPLSLEEQKARKQAIAKTVLQAMKRLKDSS